MYNKNTDVKKNQETAVTLKSSKMTDSVASVSHILSWLFNHVLLLFHDAARLFKSTRSNLVFIVAYSISALTVNHLGHGHQLIS